MNQDKAKMRLLPIAVTGAFMMLAGSGTVVAQGSDLFQQLDQDGDGQISKEEAEIYPALSRQFDQVDTNGDGSLSPSEFSAVQGGGAGGGAGGGPGGGASGGPGGGAGGGPGGGAGGNQY